MHNDAPDPLIGALIDGRYRIDRVVGEGGFGTVYAALHVGLGAMVAVKVPKIDDLPPSVVSDAIAMFIDEGRTLKRLRHPNLVAALDVGLLPPNASGRALPYLVLEWCAGSTLKEFLAARASPMAPHDAWMLLRPVFDAIAHAHAHGVAHRDLKPANIILEPGRDGTLVPRVIDFGIAKVLGDNQRSGPANTRTTSVRRAFTPKYAAPEQLAGVRTGPWTDVYTLALILLELVMGRAVFATDDDARSSMLGSALPTPRTLGVQLGAWDREIERALDPRPTGRFADAGELMRALDGNARTANPFASYRPPMPSATPAAPSGSQSTFDHSMVPSSRTLRTAMEGAATRPPTAPPNTRRGTTVAILAAMGVAVAASAAFIGVRYRQDAWPFGRPAVAAPTSSATASATAEPALRPLESLQQDELVARGQSAGLQGCQSSKLPATIILSCLNGTVTLADRTTGQPDPHRAIQLNLQYQAKTMATAQGAARFTIDGTWGLLVATRTEIVDDVTTRILLGVRHGEIFTDQISYADRKIPPRLALWQGPELAPRIVAAGASVSFDAPYESIPSAAFYLGAESGSIMLVRTFGEQYLKMQKKPGATPFVYAIDGENLLILYPSAKLDARAFLKNMLGDTQATQVGRYP